MNIAATNQMVLDSIWLHTIFVGMMVVIVAYQLFSFDSKKSFKKFGLRYEKIVLYYRAFLAAIAFTGVVVLAVMKFDISWQVYLMIFAFLVMFVGTIKEYIFYKSTRLSDLESQKIFFEYAKRKYTIDLALLLLSGFFFLV